MLKDDKTYPYIKITAERHPKLIITRKVKKIKENILVLIRMLMRHNETKKLLDRLYPLSKMSYDARPSLFVLSSGPMSCTLCQRSRSRKHIKK